MVTKQVNLKKKQNGKFLITLFINKLYSIMECSIVDVRINRLKKT